MNHLPIYRRAAFLEYPGHGLGPGQNETTQARVKIPRQAKMATVIVKIKVKNGQKVKIFGKN